MLETNKSNSCKTGGFFCFASTVLEMRDGKDGLIPHDLLRWSCRDARRSREIWTSIGLGGHPDLLQQLLRSQLNINSSYPLSPHIFQCFDAVYAWFLWRNKWYFSCPDAIYFCSMFWLCWPPSVCKQIDSYSRISKDNLCSHAWLPSSINNLTEMLKMQEGLHGNSTDIWGNQEWWGRLEEIKSGHTLNAELRSVEVWRSL